MKRILSLSLALLILALPLISIAENLEPEIFGEGAILIDAKSGQVLFEKNPDKKFYPASTTKIMTCILALENGKLDDYVTVDQEVIDLTDGSHIALDVGEQVLLRDLIYALMIGSSNDAALAIGKHISGNLPAFIELMNSKAQELGAKNTNFVNPNGLHHDDHYSSPRDLALIGQYAMKNDTFRSIVKEYLYQVPRTNKKDEPRFLKSCNRLLYSTIKIDVDGELVASKYEGANGIKTGYTTKANNCLVSSVERDDRHLIAVVLNSNKQNVFSDSHKLYNYGFYNFKKLKLANKNTFIENFEIDNGLPNYVAGVLDRDLSYNIPWSESSIIDEKIIPFKAELPLKTGDKIASVEYYSKGNKIAEANVVSTMDVAFDESQLLKNKILDRWYLLVFLILIINQVLKYFRRLRLIKRRKNLS